jgi:hypothetical protein
MPLAQFSRQPFIVSGRASGPPLWRTRGRREWSSHQPWQPSSPRPGGQSMAKPDAECHCSFAQRMFQSSMVVAHWYSLQRCSLPLHRLHLRYTPPTPHTDTRVSRQRRRHRHRTAAHEPSDSSRHGSSVRVPERGTELSGTSADLRRIPVAGAARVLWTGQGAQRREQRHGVSCSPQRRRASGPVPASAAGIWGCPLRAHDAAERAPFHPRSCSSTLGNRRGVPRRRTYHLLSHLVRQRGTISVSAWHVGE